MSQKEEEGHEFLPNRPDLESGGKPRTSAILMGDPKSAGTDSPTNVFHTAPSQPTAQEDLLRISVLNKVFLWPL